LADTYSVQPRPPEVSHTPVPSSSAASNSCLVSPACEVWLRTSLPVSPGQDASRWLFCLSRPAAASGGSRTALLLRISAFPAPASLDAQI